ncbi:MAG TPA: glycosyltransferase family 4 protein [Chloroflexota bacterium]|nr:glycosyltransferase family 4 protein [Chloroflexota bacterium]
MGELAALRILAITPFLPRPDAKNAGTLVMFWRISAMAKRHQVTLLTFLQPGEEPAPGEPLAALGVETRSLRRMALQSRMLRRLRLGARWLRSGRPLPEVEFFDARMQRLIDDAVARERFQLVQVETAYKAPIAAYRLPAGVPSLLVEHEVALVPAAEERSRAKGWLARPLALEEWRRWKRYERAVWPRYTHIEAVTNRDAEAIRRIVPHVAARVKVNPVGIETGPLRRKAEQDPNLMVFVGAFGHAPNVDAARWLVRDILPAVRRRCPSVRLALVGSEPPAHIQALAATNLEVTGYVPDVAPYLDRATVVVVPVRTGGGMRIKTLQALARGRAVVTTSLGADGLTVDGHIPAMVADDAEAFAKATADLLDNEPVRRKLGREARRFVAEHHSWTAHMRRLEATYCEMLGHGH